MTEGLELISRIFMLLFQCVDISPGSLFTHEVVIDIFFFL